MYVDRGTPRLEFHRWASKCSEADMSVRSNHISVSSSKFHTHPRKIREAWQHNLRKDFQQKESPGHTKNQPSKQGAFAFANDSWIMQSVRKSQYSKPVDMETSSHARKMTGSTSWHNKRYGVARNESSWLYISSSSGRLGSTEAPEWISAPSSRSRWRALQIERSLGRLTEAWHQDKNLLASYSVSLWTPGRMKILRSKGPVKEENEAFRFDLGVKASTLLSVSTWRVRASRVPSNAL